MSVHLVVLHVDVVQADASHPIVFHLGSAQNIKQDRDIDDIVSVY